MDLFNQHEIFNEKAVPYSTELHFRSAIVKTIHVANNVSLIHSIYVLFLIILVTHQNISCTSKKKILCFAGAGLYHSLC